MEGSVQGRLVGSEIHGFYTMEDLDITKIKEEAGARWLRPNEIHAILCNYNYFNINVKPVDLPKGGTIVLFDRKMLRNFRKDGHNWKKKKDGKTVKEAHEHLKVGDQDRIHVYYAHGQDNSNFVRRLYWLLDKKHEHIVLVHYREVVEDSGNQSLISPKECKEGLSFSTRVHTTSPLTPLYSSSGSASRVLSEEIDSGLEGSGTSNLVDSAEVWHSNLIVKDHELRLHEINTLDWADLVDSDPSTGPAVATKNDAQYFQQQKGYESSHLRNNGTPLGSHNSYDVPVKQPGNMNFRVKSSELTNKNDLVFDMFDKNAFQTQDSFGRWVNYIENDIPVSLDELPLEISVTSDNEPGLATTTDQLSPQQYIFNITDVSPAWGFSTEETKVIVVGNFQAAHAHLAGSSLYCVLGDKRVPMQMIQPGVFRCTALPCVPGLVNLYLTLDGQTPISQISSFEYRSGWNTRTNDGLTSANSSFSQWEEFQLQTRLAHLLFSTSTSNVILSGKVSPYALREAKKFIGSVPFNEKDWSNFMKAVGNDEVQISEANQNLFVLSLKNKLREWLLEKVLEGCKTTGFDSMGQGVIHLCAMLGYTWAIYPFSRSGLSLDFRDASGWTALHWATYCGREQMVAFLLSAGANPSLVTDPTLECPGGYTAADLASIKGYDGLAAYLAEKGLTAHFKAMSLSGNISGTLQTSEPPVPVKPENVYDDELCMRDSLAAYRTAAAAAARIQAAFREQTLKLKTKAAELEKTEVEAAGIIAALKIQHAFRKYNMQKRMAAAARIQYRFRTWKIRKDFLNMRHQAIKIQAAFRGHLMRRQYKKILWSVGVLEKAILRWRLKRKGLRGLQTEQIDCAEVKPENTIGVEDFYQISQKHAEERIERSVVRVQAMFRSHQAQKEYRRMKLACDEAKLEYEGLFYQS
ncbi:calmodulin-binding transcription activator 5-like isoform X2 [Aristolochia californica]|uniref:calmodulin-binding transcription activator 5-like isoform X2 n=1 Tax=Aristolochia californica TaxID=171875 RepID=UPI0035E1150C